MVGDYGYSFSTLGGDYIRSIGGILVCSVPMFIVPIFSAVFFFFLTTAVFFVILLLRTILRHMTTVVVTSKCIRIKNLFETTLYWDTLTDFTVSYFTTWRGGGKGWMQLRLGGAGSTLRIESSLIGFKEVASQAVAATSSNQIKFDSATLTNLEFLGLRIGSQGTDV